MVRDAEVAVAVRKGRLASSDARRQLLLPLAPPVLAPIPRRILHRFDVILALLQADLRLGGAVHLRSVDPPFGKGRRIAGLNPDARCAHGSSQASRSSSVPMVALEKQGLPKRAALEPTARCRRVSVGEIYPTCMALLVGAGLDP